MVCIYCSGDLRVTNSRPKKKLNQTWRRRYCEQCKSTLTTREEIRLDASLVVRYENGAIAPFSRDKLFVSLYESLKHTEGSVDAAKELSYTVSQNLIKNSLKGATIDQKDIIIEAATVLKLFNSVAGLHYEARYKR